MRYDFVERHRDRWPVRLMCRVLRVSSSGHHDRQGSPPGIQAAWQDALGVAIKAIPGATKARYGSPRGHAELVARSTPCFVHTVAGLTRRDGFVAKTKRKFGVTTDSNHDRPVAENVVDRQFQPREAGRTLTADITYIATGECWLYLAAVEDLYSKRIVG